jgi:hypothetical protein
MFPCLEPGVPEVPEGGLQGGRDGGFRRLHHSDQGEDCPLLPPREPQPLLQGLVRDQGRGDIYLTSLWLTYCPFHRRRKS